MQSMSTEVVPWKGVFVWIGKEVWDIWEFALYSTNNHMSELFKHRLSLVVNIAAMLCTCIHFPCMHPPPPPPHSLWVFCIPSVGKRQNAAYLRVGSHKLLCRKRCHHRSCVLDMFVCSEVRKWVRSRGMQAKTPILLALFATCPAKHTRNVSQITDKELSKPSREDWESKRLSRSRQSSIDEAERAITWASQYKMYMLPWKCEAPEQGFEKCNFGHLSGLANCSSKLRVTFLGDPHHKIYVVVVRRQVFKTATLAGGLIGFMSKVDRHRVFHGFASLAEVFAEYLVSRFPHANRFGWSLHYTHGERLGISEEISTFLSKGSLTFAHCGAQQWSWDGILVHVRQTFLLSDKKLTTRSLQRSVNSKC